MQILIEQTQSLKGGSKDSTSCNPRIKVTCFNVSK